MGEPRQVVVGAATQAALGDVSEFELQALGPVRVKGKREPVEAWLLLQDLGGR